MSNPQLSQSQSSGIGFLGLLAAGLTILFVALKLTGAIAWPWIGVLAPALIYVGLGIAILALILVGLGLYVLFVWIGELRREKKFRTRKVSR